MTNPTLGRTGADSYANRRDEDAQQVIARLAAEEVARWPYDYSAPQYPGPRCERP